MNVCSHDRAHASPRSPVRKASSCRRSRASTSTVTLSDRCCGEAGTLGTARPDIANQLRFRKLEELRQGIRALSGTETTLGQVKMLTSCPACQQGLARYADETGLETDYIVVELARHLLGPAWRETFVTKAKAGGIERVLL